MWRFKSSRLRHIEKKRVKPTIRFEPQSEVNISLILHRRNTQAVYCWELGVGVSVKLQEQRKQVVSKKNRGCWCKSNLLDHIVNT